MDLKTRRPGHPVRAWSSAHFASSAVGYGDAFPSWPLLYSSPRSKGLLEWWNTLVGPPSSGGPRRRAGKLRGGSKNKTSRHGLTLSSS